jgi:xanthine dehydrogenase iron-sulfur cluster and FAD-binding subunit A
MRYQFKPIARRGENEEMERDQPSPKTKIRAFRVNGRVQDILVADATLLVDTLRETLGLTGTKQGCDGGLPV